MPRQTEFPYICANNNGMEKFKYNKDSHVTNIDEVKAFIEHIIVDCKVNWHPDDDASVYIELDTGEPTFTPEQAEIVNRMTDECFDVAEAASMDRGGDWVYDYAFDVLYDLLHCDCN